MTPGVASDPAAPAPAPRSLRLSELPREPLAGEGNFVWKIPFAGGTDGAAVLKVYFGSRGALLHWKKTLGNRLLTGRSSHMPRARFRQETECIRLWERHGFRCFGMHPDVRVEGLPEQGYMLYDWTPGRHFREYFVDQSVPWPERLATWRRFVGEWHRRHELAVALSEPRLIHENGDVKHVMLWQGGFTYFDFEICFTSRKVRDLVGRELLAYLRSCGKFFGAETYDALLDELVAHYPDKTLLLAAWEHAFRNENLFIRLGRRLDHRLKPKHQSRWSKYAVALDLRRRLDAASLTGGRRSVPTGTLPTGALRGNRVWRVETARGTVVQKYYGERGPLFTRCVRELGYALRGGKSRPSGAARRATEGRLLELWRVAGFDVPRELSGEHPGLVNARTRILEWIEGRSLQAVLEEPGLPEATRRDLLQRFARTLAQRHRLALERQESGLIQEHGSLDHVLVCGERLVSFDLENAYVRRGDLRPLVAKEVAECLRSLARIDAGAHFAEDLRLFVQA